MRALELLIEDYERRLKTITESIEKKRSNGSIVHQRREERLNTKASEYRTFIAELKRAMAVDTSASTCNLQNVVRSLRFDKPTETGWLFDGDLLRNITHKANKHDPLISMEQVEYVLRAIADKQ